LKKLFLTILPIFALAQYSATISPITPAIKQRMIKGGSYKNYCPININDLRYIKLKFIGFDYKEHTGELIVNKSIANDIVVIFKKLYDAKYPIKQMRLVSDFGASDYKSIEADNTSAFNCRFVAGTNKWSNHTYGKAIDINPIQNPYVKHSRTSHAKSYKYINRVRKNKSPSQKAMMLKSDFIVKLFKSYGFRWGGDWNCCKDYQHFDK